ncbi:MAG: hypothetical protein ACOCV3_03055 [Halanaerobiales bacterium]
MKTMNDKMIGIILVSSILMLIALFTDSAILFAFSFPFLLFAWMYAGALKNGQIGKGYKYSLISILLIWLIGFTSMVLMDTSSVPEIYFGGFPLATAIMVYFVWGLPFITGTYTFGYFFESNCINEKELKELENYLKQNE